LESLYPYPQPVKGAAETLTKVTVTAYNAAELAAKVRPCLRERFISNTKKNYKKTNRNYYKKILFIYNITASKLSIII
jgi:hypothetical protein